MLQTEVVIVGGGIGGAVLALALARGGRTSAVVERDPARARAGRPEVLWPATMETLDRLGVGATIRPLATRPLVAVEMNLVHDDGRIERLLRLGDELPGAAAFHRWSTDPAKTRELVLEAAAATGRVHLLRGVEAKEVLRDAAGVRVRGVRGAEDVEIRGAVVVGDDGANSPVRASLGLPLTTKLFPVELLCAVAPGGGFLGDEGHAYLNPGGLKGGIVGAFFVPMPQDRVAVVAPATFDAWDGLVAAGHAGFRATLARFAPPAAHLADVLRFPEDFVRVRRPVGHAKRYVADRGAILGDAAHPVSPAGGQGANMAVADAAALAEVLLARLASGDLSAAALAPYEHARRAANERSVAISRRAGRFVEAARRFPALLSLAGVVTRGVARSTRTKDRILRAFATSFVGDPVEL